MILAGVDEAGRGSVLGPLVVAGVAVDESKIPELVELGVKDSKLLSPQKRRSLYGKIKKLASQVACQKIFPKQIDEVVFRGERLFRLNYLEAKIMSSVLDQINFDRAFIDCCDTNQLRFGQLVSDLIADRRGWSFTVGERNPLVDQIVSEHHADRNYPVVAAASIIAKVTRDASLRSLRKIHGDLGSGYPSDHFTVSYLKQQYEKRNSFPHFTRLSWITVQRIQGKVVEEEDEDLMAKLIESDE